MSAERIATLENAIRDSKLLADSAAGVHYWQDLKRQYTDVRNKADMDIQHANECIASHAARLQEALTELGLTVATEAEAGA